MQPAFLESWLNEPAGRRHIVLGRRLRPFCAYHRLLLESVGSPLIQGEQSNLADVETAVRICQLSYRTPLERTLPNPPRSWIERCWQRGRIAWVSKRHSPTEAGAAFIRYVSDYYAPPVVWQDSRHGAQETQNNLPDMLAVVAQLMAAGVPEAEAWEMPLGRAQWYAIAFARQKGADIRLVTESNQLFRALDILKARLAEKQKKSKP